MRRHRTYVIIVTIAALAVTGVVLADYLHREREFHERTACVGSLTRIRLTKIVYADEHRLIDGAVIPDEVVWRENGQIERCLSGGQYSVNPVGTVPSCSYTGVVRWSGRLWRHEYPSVK